MESVGCTYVLIHLYTYVTVTLKEKRPWVWEGVRELHGIYMGGIGERRRE